MTAPAAGPARLGWYVKQSRTRKRLSVAAAAKLADISRPAWTNIENGVGEPYDTTLVAVEDVLGWAPGSCAATRGGGEPTLADADDELPDATPQQMADAILSKSDEELYAAGFEKHEISFVRAFAELIARKGTPGENGAIRASG